MMPEHTAHDSPAPDEIRPGTSSGHSSLSPGARLRREAMLPTLLAELRERRHRRARRRHVAAIALLLLVGGAATIAVATRHETRPGGEMARNAVPVTIERTEAPGAPVAAPTATNPTHEPRAIALAHAVRVERVPTDPMITSRLSGTATIRVERISDGALLEVLNDLGSPCGIVRVGGPGSPAWLTCELPPPERPSTPHPRPG